MASSNGTETEGTTNPRNSTIVIAIVVPACLLVAFFTLLMLNRRRGYVLPRINVYNWDDPIAKEERMKRRQDVLENNIQTQHFYDWLATQKEKNPESIQETETLCTICLDEFSDDAQIRGLHCSHAFHAKCLDEWFTRYNVFCPLCHRAIVPGVKFSARPSERQSPLPVVLMV